MASIVDKSTLVDSQDSKSIKARSKFDLSHHHLTTLPFGEYVPFFSLECVNGDNINLRSQHSLNTFTLKSPILSNIRMRKDYFSVPMESILPFNWDKIITNPLFGDDVDAEKVNCVLNLSLFNFNASSNKSFVQVFNANFNQAQTKKIGLQLNLLTIAELFFSNGSLLSRMGYNFNKLFQFSDSDAGVRFENGIDDIIEDYYNKLPGTLEIQYYSDNNVPTKETFHLDTAEQKRIFHDFALTHCFDPTFEVVIPAAISVSYLIQSIDSAGKNMKFNIAPICAYQICCAHYLSNDKVDAIYSAELYRQLMNYCISGSGALDMTFLYNGVKTPYDYLSGMAITTAFQYMIANFVTPNNPASLNLPFNYFVNLLGMRRSLRYLDYFTGAKTHPLALGDTSVKVSSANSVDVVDVTKGLQMQRFLNFVNRTGRKFEEYISKLNGRYVAPDYHNPQFLGSTVESLYNPTVENTGSDQFTKPNSITSTMKGESERFAFQFDCDRPSIVLGIVSFDIVRAYANNVTRDASHIDRFDYFNPFLQHIGDQPIFGYEYLYDLQGSFDTNYFGYQTRHSEYKTAVSRADSGFIDGSLPSWCFLNEYFFRPLDKVSINSDIIRSYPEELDKFYLSLPGISLSRYFHFIVDFYNIVEASRPMIANPNIL